MASSSRRPSPRIRQQPPSVPAATDAAAADLLAAYQAGEPDAFEAIVETFQHRLVQFFFRLCWDRDRSEDFTQEVFLRLMRGAKTYRPEGRLSTFIYRIATNLWIDHYRSQRPQPRLYSLDHALLAKDMAPRQEREVSAEDRAISDEEKQGLRDALENLTEPHRLVFELAVYQEMAYADVGRVLGIPVGTVKSRMHNAVKALKGILAAQIDGDENPESSTDSSDGASDGSAAGEDAGRATFRGTA